MKLPVRWLREYIETPLTDAELADALTMAGLEVEETTASDFGPVFHTKVTPNRGDWMSVLGHAREAAAALDVPLLYVPPRLPDEQGDVLRWAGVRVEDANLCPRYCAKIIRNVQSKPAPQWMQDKLIAAGMRSVNAVVDITNFVMLEMGQPLHAFDYDTLPEGQIIVRRAHKDEVLTTLDGMERTLTPETLLICTKDGPAAVAGVMGGQTSEVSEHTRTVLLESAHFSAQTVRRSSKLLALSTEASYRYERFVDPALCPLALERAAELLAEHAGGEVVAGRIDLYPVPVLPQTLELRPARCNALLGTNLTSGEMAQCLRRLQLEVDEQENALRVTVPTFRPDIVGEIDLVEEVGRMMGYANLPETLPAARGGSEHGNENAQSLFAGRLRTALSGMGVQEALTNSLVPPSPLDNDEDGRRVAIRSALSAELSGLRTSLIPNLLEAMSRNLRRRTQDAALFETGKVFAQGDGEAVYKEPRRVGAVLTGKFDNAPADFFTAKGIVETLAHFLHVPTLQFQPAKRNGMHPGRCADVYVSHEKIGFVAEVDPLFVTHVLEAPASTGRVAVLELDADALRVLSHSRPQYSGVPRFADSIRDLAVIVDDGTPYALLESVSVNTADPNLLRGVSLVSIYKEPPIPEGKKSVALRFTFRADDRTLTDAEMDAQVNAVRVAMVNEIGASER